MTTGNPTSDRKEFLGCGWAMPVELDPLTGLVARVEHEEDIRQSIRIIVETQEGERVMRPRFGCGIHEMAFAAIDTTAIQRIKSTIEEALRRCEARIEVLDIIVQQAPLPVLRNGQREVLQDGELLIELEYRVRKTNQVGNLVFPFYFAEGGRP
ncbi:MAG TPA: GPW/gp25 family protein [Gemmatimonadaceae bacterium]|jgi:phage baseplate assembly protein W|nr:GPW/gp25 family protein [Gemmatimonadaceae bacterium]